MNEWQLLLDSDGIKLGDMILVEKENGNTCRCKLLKFTEKYVYLRTHDGEVIRFSAETLESKATDMLIVGKA